MNRKTLEEYQSTLENKLNTAINLIDYFLVIGPDPSIANKEWLYTSSIHQLNKEHLNDISPKILSKFPPINKTITGIDDSFVNHCFPNGYYVKEYIKPPSPVLFHILLDNNTFSSEYSFKYVTCLKFYESIQNYKKIYDKINNQNDINHDTMSLHNVRISNVFAQTFRSSSRSNLSSITTFTKENETNLDLNSIEINDNESTITSIQCTNSTKTARTISSKLPHRKYYFPKVICFISLHPFLMDFAKILRSIYNYSTVMKQSMPIEKIIENLTIETPVPPRGIYEIEYSLLNERITLKQNCMNELPTLNIEFDKLFSLFTLEEVLEIFKNVMLNSRIVFFSSNISLLTPLILTSISLVYPFKYPFSVVSILPKDAYHLIDNISAIIVGVNEVYSESFFKENDIDITDMILVVDVDNKTLHSIYAPNYETLPELPLSAKSKLIEKLKSLFHDVHHKAMNKTKENIRELQMSIRNYFLGFQVKIMKNYYKYLDSNIYNHRNGKKNPLYSAFREKDFINSIKDEDKKFYMKFTETQMFCDYIYKRMTPKTKTEKIDVLYFEEMIFNNINNNDSNNNCIFINSKEYQITKKFTVNKIKPLSQHEQSFYLDNITKENLLLNNGVYIQTISNKVNDNHHIYFTYYIFPKLESEFYFKTNIKHYYLVENLTQEIMHITADLESKSHLNSLEIKNCEMENYLYLTWLKLWAYSFHYHDKKERKYRFAQMLSVLDKVTHQQMDIFNLLFTVLSSNAVEDEFYFVLYQRLLNYRLNPSIYIFDIIKQLLDKKGKANTDIKKQLSKGIESNDTEEDKQLQFICAKFENENYENDKKDFKRRTFKNKYDIHITLEQIQFYMNDNCMECQEDICLVDVIEHLNECSKDIVWAKCPNCGCLFLPKLTVKFGKEFNKKGDLSISTSIQDNIVVYSPFSLYYTMIDTIKKDKEKFDVKNFRKNYTPLYWNALWYFQMKNLPYDFFLPYEEGTATFSCFIENKIKNEEFDVAFTEQFTNKENENEDNISQGSDNSYYIFNNLEIVSKEIEIWILNEDDQKDLLCLPLDSSSITSKDENLLHDDDEDDEIIIDKDCDENVEEVIQEGEECNVEKNGEEIKNEDNENVILNEDCIDDNIELKDDEVICERFSDLEIPEEKGNDVN